MKVNLEAGQEIVVGRTGRHFRIFTAESDLEVELIGNHESMFSGELAAGVGIDFSDTSVFPVPFDQIRLKSKTAQSVKLWAELAKADDDRLSGDFNVNAALAVAQTAPKTAIVHDVQSISALTEVLPLNAIRKTSIVQVSGSVFIGGKTKGISVSGKFGWDNQSKLELEPESGTVEVRILEEQG